MRILSLCIGAGLSALIGGASISAPYPERPVRVVVPFAAGSASDVVGRILLERMGDELGHRFVVENQAGASGNVGTATAARAEPNGYTLLLAASGPLAVNQWLYPNMPYDPLTAFDPIGLVATLPNVIVVHAGSPIRTLDDLVAAAKARPGEINYGSIGNGSSQHLAAAYFEQVTGTRMTHVPYRVTGQLVTDLVSGQLDVSFQLIPNVLGQIRAGTIRPLALTAPVRSPSLADVPTTRELGIEKYEAYGWFALLAPRGTPSPALERLHAAYNLAMNDPQVRRRISEVGAEPSLSTPQDLRTFMEAEARKWQDIVRSNNIKAE